MTKGMEGGCFCGDVRYRIDANPIHVNACHCRDCQKLTGSAFAVNIMIEASRVALLQGEPVTEMSGTRCPRCHVLLWATHPMFGEAVLFLRAGTLDASEAIVPQTHFFVRSKHPWVPIPSGVKAYETLPGANEPVLPAAAQARVDAARTAAG